MVYLAWRKASLRQGRVDSRAELLDVPAVQLGIVVAHHVIVHKDVHVAIDERLEQCGQLLVHVDRAVSGGDQRERESLISRRGASKKMNHRSTTGHSTPTA